MVELQSNLEELESAGIRVVAVSYDSQEILKKFAERAEIKFPLLSDEKSEAIKAFGVKNEDVRAGSRQEGIPHPGTFVIDGEGVIRAKLFVSVRKRHTSEQLLEAVKQLKSAN